MVLLSTEQQWEEKIIPDTVEVLPKDFLPAFSSRAKCEDDRSRSGARPVSRGRSGGSWAQSPANQDSAVVRPSGNIPHFLDGRVSGTKDED